MKFSTKLCGGGCRTCSGQTNGKNEFVVVSGIRRELLPFARERRCRLTVIVFRAEQQITICGCNFTFNRSSRSSSLGVEARRVAQTAGTVNPRRAVCARQN